MSLRDAMWDEHWRLDEVRYGLPHNVLAHPLLALWPAMGERLHEITRDTVPTWRARCRRRWAR